MTQSGSTPRRWRWSEPAIPLVRGNHLLPSSFFFPSNPQPSTLFRGNGAPCAGSAIHRATCPPVTTARGIVGEWVMGMGAINGDDTRTVAETARFNSRWNKVSIKSPFFSTILWPVRWKIGVFLPWCGWSIDAAVARRIGCFSGAVDGTIRTCLVERKKLIYRGEGNQFDSFSC